MKDLQTLRKELMEETRKKLKKSIGEEAVLFQEYHALDELSKTINKLSVKLTEWFSSYVPEITKLETQEEILKLILLKDKRTIINELGEKETIGSETKKGYEEALELAEHIKGLIGYKEKLEGKISELTKEIAPHTCEVVNPIVLAHLLTKVGGLSKLARMPSTAIQLIGAEKALFRHLRDKKNNPPKYGLLSGAVDAKDNKEKAKKTKQLASKIAIAARRDYYGSK